MVCCLSFCVLRARVRSGTCALLAWSNSVSESLTPHSHCCHPYSHCLGAQDSQKTRCQHTSWTQKEKRWERSSLASAIRCVETVACAARPAACLWLSA
eukprot:519350-Rhodomonas_salina.1